jgi:hypothetical protein
MRSCGSASVASDGEYRACVGSPPGGLAPGATPPVTEERGRALSGRPRPHLRVRSETLRSVWAARGAGGPSDLRGRDAGAMVFIDPS